MTSLLIKNVPEDVLRQLKLRARAHQRSLQDEVLTILAAVATLGAVDSKALSEKIRKLLGTNMSSTTSRPKPAPVKLDSERGTQRQRKHNASKPTAPTQIVRKRK